MKQKFHSAFTIVELLIVIVIIGILAGLTIVGIGSWRTHVAETEVKNDAAGIFAGMEDARNRLNGYPTFSSGTEFDGTNSTKDIFTQSEFVTITYSRGNAKAYCVDIRSKAVPGVYLFLDTTSGNRSPMKGTCDGGEGATPPSPDQTVFVFDTTAPGCTGTVQLPVSQPTTGGTVNWGDGTTQARSGSLMAHTYATPGRYTVVYTGPMTQASYYSSVNATNAKCLTRVQQWANNVSPTRVSFYNASNLVYVAEPPSSVISMSNMFFGASSFNQPIGSWNTANVADMTGMFRGATSFNQPINTWNTSNVTAMSNMFFGASSFNQPIGSWNTTKVGDMASMFQEATSFNQPIGTWNTANVTIMYRMFFRASSFNQPIGSWNTTKVNDIYSMFQDATSFNQPIGTWNTANVTNMNSMFSGATSFNQPIGTWNTANVTGMSGMFYRASSFDQNISGWDVAGVTSKSSFHSGAALTQTNCPPSLW